MQQDIVKDVLKAFDQAGLWEDGLELIGSWCFFMYQKHLGAKGLPLKTIDIVNPGWGVYRFPRS